MNILQIGDALVKLEYPFGGFLDGITMWSPSRQGHGGESPTIIGEATTVKVKRWQNTNTEKYSSRYAQFHSWSMQMTHQAPRRTSIMQTTISLAK